MSSSNAAFCPVVLVAPLDWGLGHATRCIPIIERLLARNLHVILGGSGASGALLRASFPDLDYYEIPAHTIRYSRGRSGFLWKILRQLPKLRRALAAEKAWMEAFARERRINAVISDNRYGLRLPGLPCVLVTHQLEIRTPAGALGNAVLRSFHYRLIGRFTRCWVPDNAVAGLAGKLSHPARLPKVPLRYIGTLSRFEAAGSDLPAVWSLVVLLSGPEPQRTIWETELLPQLAKVAGSVLLLRGLPGAADGMPAPANVTVRNHLPAVELQALLRQTRFVLARCGYSTVMDLAATESRGILVPTPGQTEQEYLAAYLHQKRYAFCLPQKGFDLKNALEEAANFVFTPLPKNDGSALDQAIDELLSDIPRPETQS